MICPYMPTASNYMYLPPLRSLVFLLVAKFGTENAASPTIHNRFRSPVEIPVLFLGGMPDGPMIGPKKMAPFP